MKKFITWLKGVFNRDQIVIHYNFDETPEPEYELMVYKGYNGDYDLDKLTEIYTERWRLINVQSTAGGYTFFYFERIKQ